jgi:hypothetical protein
VKETVTAGVDAITVYGHAQDKDQLSEVVKTAGDVPVGIILQGEKEKEDIAAGNGPDFIIFDLSASPALLAKEGMGRLLVISEMIIPGMIKAINDLSKGVDGVVIDFKNNKLDMQFVLTCHMFSDLLNKPLLVRLYQRNITGAELKALSEAGVCGMLLPKEIPVSGIKSIKKSIASLPAAPRRKGDIPLIPGLGVSRKEETEVEEPEEE